MKPIEVLNEILEMGLPYVKSIDDVLGLLPALEDEPYPFIELMESVGGYEDGPRQCYCVVKYKDKFYKLSYDYSSYGGPDYDSKNFKEVVPAEKLITVYEYI